VRRLIVLGAAAVAAALAATGCSDSKNPDGPDKTGVEAFDDYIKKSTISEARFALGAMARGAEAYYLEMHIAPGTVNALPPQFPASVQTTPALGSCCEGEGGTCPARASDWEAPGWVALHFSMTEPHHYMYRFTRAEDGGSFTAEAFGDLDCDGEHSTFRITGTGNGEEVSIGDLSRTNELE
jgi:hypothetical protein